MKFSSKTSKMIPGCSIVTMLYEKDINSRAFNLAQTGKDISGRDY